MASRWAGIEQELTGQTRLDAFRKEDLARLLAGEISGLVLYPMSASRTGGRGIVLAAAEGSRPRLVAVTGARAGFAEMGRPVGEVRREGVTVRVFDADAGRLALLREQVSWLRPRTCPEGRGALGIGDPLGIMTPAGVRGVEGSGLFPCFTVRQGGEEGGRRLSAAVSEVVFGVFREGYEAGFGVEAAGLRGEEEVREAAAAGTTRYTLDLSGCLASCEGVERKELSRRYVQLEREMPEAAGWRRRYLGRSFEVGAGLMRERVMFDERTFLKTALRTAGVLRQAGALSGVVGESRRGQAYEVEVSLADAAERTTLAEHLFVTLELAEMGRPVAAFAPRLGAEVCEGVEFAGNPSRFGREVALHAACARAGGGHAVSVARLGGNLSLLSLVADATSGVFVARMAGSCVVEALRVVVRRDRELFERLVAGGLAGFADEADLHAAAFFPATTVAAAELEEGLFETRSGRRFLMRSAEKLVQSKGLRDALVDFVREHEEACLGVVSAHVREHAARLMG